MKAHLQMLSAFIEKHQCAGHDFLMQTLVGTESEQRTRAHAGMLLVRSLQQGTHQEADKAEVGVLRAKAAEIKDAKDGLAVAIQLVYGLL